MEIETNSATLTSKRLKPKSVKPSPAESPFAQIFKNAATPARSAPIIPAAATLTPRISSRSTYFMETMPLELRRSAVEDKHFQPKPAALERITGSAGRVLSQGAVGSGE